jgi:hypothetical protein
MEAAAADPAGTLTQGIVALLLGLVFLTYPYLFKKGAARRSRWMVLSIQVFGGIFTIGSLRIVALGAWALLNAKGR